MRRTMALCVLSIALFSVGACYGGRNDQQTGAGKPCTTYADCTAGMICQGAGPNRGGTCNYPSTNSNEHRMGIDVPPRGLLATVFGQPIIKGQPPPGAPADQAGGTWDLRTTTYYPPQGGGWRYSPGPNHGFGGHWVFDSTLKNPAPGREVVMPR